LLAPVVVNGGAHAHIHRKTLSCMPLVDSANGSYIAVVAPVRDANVLQAKRLPQRRIKPHPTALR
jgi:hypothetical protein